MNRAFVEAQIPGLNEEIIILAQERLDAVLWKFSHILPRIKGLIFFNKAKKNRFTYHRLYRRLGLPGLCHRIHL